ncbi:MAG: WG repeat protein [Bacteroidetes bacterium HLUCCA01]|nr:MAG: WG repeat protein [Bacteroidetes bacterium HLUCCA01]
MILPPSGNAGSAPSSRVFKNVLLLLMATLLAGCGIFDSGSDATPQGVDARALHPVLINGKWGFIGGDGSVRIPPQYDEARFPSGGMVAVRSGTRWGFLPEADAGSSITVQFAQAGDFYEDRAAVRPEVTAGYGYIDPSGNMVIQPEYDAAGMFSEGRAAVLSDGLWGYVNATGEVVLSLQYSQAGRFSSGLAAVETAEGWQYVGLDGETIIQPGFRLAFAGPFADGLAPVQTTEGWGYIDENGVLTIPVRFEEAFAFSQGLARFRSGSYYGFINTSGEVVIQPQFDEARDFSEGMAAVRIGSAWFYIRSVDGRLAFLPPDGASGAGDFRSGLARVRIGGEDPYFGYLNATGTYVWFPSK